MLVYFKYVNFFLENFNAALQIFGFSEVRWTAIALPIGISFYTFQTLTYSIDVYRKVHAPLEKVTDYLLYIMSFPQMIAGPIVRFGSIANQISKREESVDDKLIGIYRFSIGLAKKVLIANVMAEQADLIFNSNISELNMTSAWLGILAFTFQIYFDFSGYSDMAIGLGRLMGFRFPENFDAPYTAQSISEFWRRWHITLGNFMRDYLYIPLGGNRVKSAKRLYFNLWFVFVLSGLWHGASWNFVLWGIYHGVLLTIDRLFLLKLLSYIGKIPAVIVTFLLVMMGWIIFRLENVEDIWTFFTRLFSFNSVGKFEVIPYFHLTLILSLMFSFFTLFQRGKDLDRIIFNPEQYTLKHHLYMMIVGIILLILAISFMISSELNPFIYFRF